MSRHGTVSVEWVCREDASSARTRERRAMDAGVGNMLRGEILRVQ